MKKFAVLFYCLAFVGAVLATSPLGASDLACVAENNVSEADAIKFAENYEFDENDHAFKCFLKCAMQHGELINENGDYDQETLVDFIVNKNDREDNTTPEQKSVLLNTCDTTEVSGDACEKAAAAVKCLIQLRAALIRLPAETTE